MNELNNSNIIKVQAKKSLGQNFLRNETALQAMVTAPNTKNGDWVLEIGPGEGILTEKLINTGAIVIAVEKDDRLIEILNKKFENKKNFFLIHEDVLNIEMDYVLQEFNRLEETLKINTDENENKLEQNNLPQNRSSNKSFKLIANIPYYITGMILRKFVDDNKAESITLLVQDEVAKRIVCRDGKYSLLSLSVLAYGRAKYIKKVLAGSFVPAPKVDSAIIYIEKYKEYIFKDVAERDEYFKLIHAGLAHKRKTLLHNLKEYNKKNVNNTNRKNVVGNVDRNKNDNKKVCDKNNETDWINIFKALNLDQNIRGEDVDFDIWMKILRATL